MLREVLRVAVAGNNIAENAEPGDPGDVCQYVMHLDIHLR